MESPQTTHVYCGECPSCRMWDAFCVSANKGWLEDDGETIRVIPLEQIYKTVFGTSEIAALPDGDAAPTTPETDLDSAQKRVSDIMGDFDKGLIRKPDAIRVRDRAARAVKDMDGYKGFGKRYGEEGYGEN